ncbi:MAG: hypothetical protein V4685_08270 [Bacteroidota bacterium]
MKKLLLSAAISFITITAFSQARTATADYNKTMQPAVEIEIPFEEKTVMKSLVEKMEKKGYKGKESKDYMVFKGVTMSELGTGTYDLYFKADRKSRKEKDITVLTMLVSGGYEKFISEADDSELHSKMKTFLDKHTEQATAYDLELQIKEQTEAVEKAAKKYTNSVEDGEDLVKKKEKLEKEIVDNTQKQADMKAESEKQVQILETLKAKRKQ